MNHCQLADFRIQKNIYKSKDLTPSEFTEVIKNYAENVISKDLESCTPRNLDKGIQHVLRLRREYLSFARERDADKKELRILFIKEHLSELLLNMSKHAKILEAEKENKTSKKYIENEKEMLQYARKVTEVHFIFNKKIRSRQKLSFKTYGRLGIY